MPMMRPEVQALIRRGDITTREFLETNPEFFEQANMIPKMSGGDLVMLAEYALRNRFLSMMSLITHELLKRCGQAEKEQLETKTCEHTGFKYAVVVEPKDPDDPIMEEYEDYLRR